MSTMRVRRATAHIRPMNQPCVDTPPWILARPVGKGSTPWLSLDLTPHHLIECLQSTSAVWCWIWGRAANKQNENEPILILNRQSTCPINQLGGDALRNFAHHVGKQSNCWSESVFQLQTRTLWLLFIDKQCNIKHKEPQVNFVALPPPPTHINTNKTLSSHLWPWSW